MDRKAVRVLFAHLKEEYGKKHANCEEDACYQVGQSERKFRNEFAIAKNSRKVLDRLCEKATKGGTDSASNSPHERQNAERSWLQLLLWHHFCNHLGSY
jgi:hypothetical protein